MRYDSDSMRILISVGELISIAKRGISGAVTENEDEPTGARPPLSVIRAVLCDAKPEAVRYGFNVEEYLFELTGTADSICTDKISLFAAAEVNPASPRKEEAEYARGVLYILGYMYAKIAGHSVLTLEAIYFSERSGEVFRSEERVSLERLEKFFSKCIGALVKYARPEVERVTERLPTMKTMRFPYAKVRDGQSELVRAAYRALSRGGTLYASAPTGTGKTVSVLYPALKLIGEGKHDKVFYLTPKSTTAKMAKECIELLAKEGAVIRALVLASKESSCTERMVCRRKVSLCRLSDTSRLADATLALYDRGITVVTLKEAREVASEYGVCPYELELCYSELCDAVICDFNYLFDPRAYIRRYFDVGGRYSVLVDEAHNLADRAREMYSAELDCDWLSSKLASPLIPESSKLRELGTGVAEAMRDTLFPYVKEEIREGTDGMAQGAVNMSEMPSEMYPLIAELLSLADVEIKRAYSAKDESAADRLELLRELFYELRRFSRCADSLDGCHRIFIFYTGGNIKIRLFAVDTGPLIRDTLNKVSGAVFFSATLSPLDYYKSVLGGDRSSEELIAHSPFAPESLSVSIIDKISTRYSERERTLPAVSRTISAVMSARRGHYMVFAPSFEYLDMLADDFGKKYPKIAMVRQRRDMTPAEKTEFLAGFEKDDGRYMVGFCVLGGLYSEGIDLVGNSLIGAVVVGIGMPSLSYEREAMTEYFDEKYEAGKQYAYIYPGMNRVLQAAGRVIRTERDRGVIVLIDDRFADPIYKKSIPALWRGMEYVGNAKELQERIKNFWIEVDKEAERMGE